eukprot:10543940-Ditylum_brightwellii.AAC.1
MPPHASGASNNTGHGIQGKGDNNHISVRSHNITKTLSTCKKHGVIYEIIAKKAKKRCGQNLQRTQQRMRKLMTAQ